MFYSRKRLDATLRIFWKTQSSREECAIQYPKIVRNLRNKSDHGFSQASKVLIDRWQDYDLDADDDEEYDPSGKTQRRKKTVEKATAASSKRKASDSYEAAESRKKIKTRPSTSEELSSKFAFITVRFVGAQGKELLQTLAKQYGNGLQARKRLGMGNALGDASMDTMTFERLQRQAQSQSYEDNFKAQTQQIDNWGGKALRNRKVPDPDVAITKKSSSTEQSSREPTGADTNDPQSLTTSPKSQPQVAPKCTNGLLSPASTPPDVVESPFSTIDDREPSLNHDIISIRSSPSPPPLIPSETIRSRWSHPIDFQYVHQPGKKPCSFCESFLYGIQGLVGRQIQVRRTGTRNKMYEEIGDIAKDEAAKEIEGPTRMCVSCALDRFHICDCSKHDLRVLPNLDPRQPRLTKETVTAYVRQIIDNEGINTNQPVHPSCMLCASPALYRCRQKQTRTKAGGPTQTGKEPRGCGLFVCGECYEMVVRCGGHLNKHFIRQSISRIPRADFEFLFEGSMMHHAYQKVSRTSPSEGPTTSQNSEGQGPVGRRCSTGTTR